MQSISDNFDNGFVKVIFPVARKDEIAPEIFWPPVNSEGVWCKRLDSGICVVDNIPFFTDLVSYGDMVQITEDPNGQLRYSSVVKRSGNTTVRVIVDQDDEHIVEDAKEVLQMLSQSDCDVEIGADGLFSVNVPKASYAEALALIVSSRDEGLWYVDPGFDITSITNV